MPIYMLLHEIRKYIKLLWSYQVSNEVKKLIKI